MTQRCNAARYASSTTALYALSYGGNAMKTETVRSARTAPLTVRSNLRAGFPIPSVVGLDPTQKITWAMGQASGKHSAVTG